jgi:hypothetical protein
MTIEERKNEMYRAFEMYLSNEINDAQLVNKLKRVLGEKKWFRYFKGDAFANDYRSVSRALSSKLNNQYERESMELSLEDRELQIYDSMSGNQLYAKGGRILVGRFDEKQLKNKEDKKAIEKAQKESGLTYIDSKIIKKGGKMFMEVYLIPNEEYHNSSKFAKGGLVKKSDFTMLGAGLLIGGLFAYFKK